MGRKNRDDFTPVEKQQNYLASEEFPEGTYGEPVNQKPLKARKYNPNQRYYTPFNYEFKELHADDPREAHNAHQPGDYPDED
ncbi:hypothetical protein [Halalkalibacillus halophilus]|uniref:hypothetical protein n=1 Tax=Halalkalibacillus halophilus TaxID=392827 RepID=UPI00042506AE|nr:hypothetical protein [Halalkalibacillus halophilus]